ncbi:helix-turn-helix domain-containing protein [Alkalilimnicola ehrlichii MLHE-1]|uniref:Transcriptional regulator, Crp/Fnr family n=1 Tax=Alkalilimnicola ehrlichii (strain ATCC BAA-1101 / DSM 17681 / MLHE-1) TaxID=187272 RepID=Q0A6R2_ALKEH|nr:helix-turn-helix domain-containing protein [Alkalilimnicola ehrlichii]ABI57475.1 transcriptional regulator, Crp/Fnr family [Alkalilimnicola ehrlichii MLHE-1]
MHDYKTDNITPLSQRRDRCRGCGLRNICFGILHHAPEADLLERLICRRGPLPSGTVLFEADDPLERLCVIRVGSARRESPTGGEGGTRRVVGFALPGEVMGLDALYQQRHPTNAVLLQSSYVCELPFQPLQALASEVPQLWHQLLRLSGEAVYQHKRSRLAMSQTLAEARLAHALLDLAHRMARRGMSAQTLDLPMPRQELGNQLGLAPNTTSRAFRFLKEQGWLEADGRQITLLDPEALAKLANWSEPTPTARSA